MTHYPWFKNTSKIDYTGYREFLSLLRYVHSSRAYYSTLNALSAGEKSEARQTVQNTHRAMLKAKSFLVHYKPKSALIRRLVYIEWQYLLKSNQLWMPRVSLAEPLSQEATIEMNELTLHYLRDKNRAIRGNDLGSCVKQVLTSLLTWDRQCLELERANNFRVSLALKSLKRSKMSLDFSFDEMVKQCEFITAHLLLSPQRAWDYKQSLVTNYDRLLGIYRHLIELSIASGKGLNSGAKVKFLSERISKAKFNLIKAQYVSARTMLIFHFPEIISTYEKRGQV